MVQTMFYISEAAREVKVENHVLRYWEEELNLPVKRNEQG
ncbi:MAG: MerR family transcriptional regulator, partial [Lachnospiraceae bacterium]|nr:MerR family transcriptional regulator [Lachnospiraceae bacterium]